MNHFETDLSNGCHGEEDFFLTKISAIEGKMK